MKITIFHNNEHTYIIISEPNLTPKEYIENIKHIWIIINSRAAELELGARAQEKLRIWS